METAFSMPADYALTDDLDIQNNDEYVDPAAPLPLTVGNYQFRVVKGGLKTNESGELVLIKDESGQPKFPIIRLEQVAIVGGEGYENLDGKIVYLYQEFDTKPREVKDFNTGQTRIANNLTELIRSNDYTISFEGRQEGLRVFAGLVEQKAAFAGRFDWLADDWRTRKTMLDAAPKVNGKLPNDVRDAIYAQTKLEGMKKFVNPKTGAYEPEFTSASGEVIEARVQIKSFNGIGTFISSKRHPKTKFGPGLTVGTVN